jgi:hypothetical protein
MDQGRKDVTGQAFWGSPSMQESSQVVQWLVLPRPRLFGLPSPRGQTKGEPPPSFAKGE